MNRMEISDVAAGAQRAESSIPPENEAIQATGPAASGPAAVGSPPDASGGGSTAIEPPGRRNSERALGGGMLKSRLAASLAAKGGADGGQPAARIASAVNIAADAVRRATPALGAESHPSVAAAMQALLDRAHTATASRPDLAAAAGGAPGNGSGAASPALDLRDWETRKADEARDAFLVTALRLVTEACFNFAAAGAPGAVAAGDGHVLSALAIDLAVHLDRLKPELAAPGQAEGNGVTDGSGFPAFVQSLRDLVVQIRKSS